MRTSTQSFFFFFLIKLQEIREFSTKGKNLPKDEANRLKQNGEAEILLLIYTYMFFFLFKKLHERFFKL